MTEYKKRMLKQDFPFTLVLSFLLQCLGTYKIRFIEFYIPMCTFYLADIIIYKSFLCPSLHICLAVSL